MQIAHKKKILAFGCIPHEPTDYRNAKRIKYILEDSPSEAKQENAHIDDQDTLWFGISWEDAEFPIFRDYGRYGAQFQQDQRTPSLVSFVGETGRWHLFSRIIFRKPG